MRYSIGLVSCKRLLGEMHRYLIELRAVRSLENDRYLIEL